MSNPQNLTASTTMARSAICGSSSVADAVDDYMEFNDTLDNFEVIAQRLA